MMKKLTSDIIRHFWYFFFIKPKIVFLRFFGASVGNDCKILTKLQNFDLRCLSLLTIGKKVTIAKNVMIFTHDGAVYRMKKFGVVKEQFRAVVIEDGVFIGAGSIILPGVVIGKDTIIGAGSVVAKDVPAKAVVVGNPARILKQY